MFCHEGGYNPAQTPFCGLRVVEALTGVKTNVQCPFDYEVCVAICACVVFGYSARCGAAQFSFGSVTECLRRSYCMAIKTFSHTRIASSKLPKSRWQTLQPSSLRGNSAVLRCEKGCLVVSWGLIQADQLRSRTCRMIETDTVGERLLAIEMTLTLKRRTTSISQAY